MAKIIEDWLSQHPGRATPLPVPLTGTPRGRSPQTGSHFPRTYDADAPDVICDAKEVAFVTEYLKDWSATKAVIRSGIMGVDDTEGTAIAKDYINRPHVQQEIMRRVRDSHYDPSITPSRVVNDIATIAFSNIWDYCEIVTNEFGGQELRLLETYRTYDGRTKPKTLGAAVKSIKQNKRGEVAIQLHDKNWALSTLTKWMGIASEKSPLDVLMEMLPDHLQRQLREAMNNSVATNGASKHIDNLVATTPNSVIPSVEDLLEAPSEDFDPCI